MLRRITALTLLTLALGACGGTTKVPQADLDAARSCRDLASLASSDTSSMTTDEFKAKLAPVLDKATSAATEDQRYQPLGADVVQIDQAANDNDSAALGTARDAAVADCTKLVPKAAFDEIRKNP